MKRSAASVVIVYGQHVLVRPTGKLFQLIGGKSQKHESPINTALRETMEEARLCLDPDRLELIHKHKERGFNHTFFLYRLNENEITNNQIPVTGKKHPQWFPVVYVRNKLMCWRGYWIAFRTARKLLYTNLLSFNPSPALS